uniref:Uncharacterized protein n=1 Tax=Kalanchoe fedtschenkoi TaxID=63787 RepID=A0A7N0TUH5_KALFE
MAELVAEELHYIREGMEKVAESIIPNIEKEIFRCIRKMDKMTPENMIKVYNALTEDTKVARTFLGYDEDMHELWIKAKFGIGIFELAVENSIQSEKLQ